MSAARHNITIEQGATFTLALVWKDSAGALVDLTGYSARMQGRTTVEGASTVFDLTSASGDITLGGALGTVTARIEATDTALVTAEEGVYDLELEDAAGTVTRLVEGKFKLSPEVTR